MCLFWLDQGEPAQPIVSWVFLLEHRRNVYFFCSSQEQPPTAITFCRQSRAALLWHLWMPPIRSQDMSTLFRHSLTWSFPTKGSLPPDFPTRLRDLGLLKVLKPGLGKDQGKEDSVPWSLQCPLPWGPLTPFSCKLTFLWSFTAVDLSLHCPFSHLSMSFVRLKSKWALVFLTPSIHAGIASLHSFWATWSWFHLLYTPF